MKLRVNTINIALVIFLIFAGYGLVVLLEKMPHKPQPEITTAPVELYESLPADGQTAPDFTFTDLQGNDVRLYDLAGRVVILNFWASWCPPCVKEFPVLLDIANQYENNVTLLALSADLDFEEVRGFFKKFPALNESLQNLSNVHVGLTDSEAHIQALYQSYKLPETFIIGPDLSVRGKFVGADWAPEEMSRMIEKIMRTHD